MKLHAPCWGKYVAITLCYYGWVDAAGTSSKSKGKLESSSASNAKNIEITVDPEDINSQEAVSQPVHMKLMTLEDLTPIKMRMNDGARNVADEVDHVRGSVSTLLTSAEDAGSTDWTDVKQQFDEFKDQALGFQETVQGAFSLLLMQNMHSESGFCCCFTLDANDICRWTQASWPTDGYFKRKGCEVLGMADFSQAMADVFDGGAKTLKSAQSCGAFVQDALQLKGNQWDLFSVGPNSIWGQHDEDHPPSRYLDNVDPADQIKLKTEWKDAHQKRDLLMTAIQDPTSGIMKCDMADLQTKLQEAFKYFLPPSTYTPLVTQLCKCGEAKETAEKLLTGQEQWDPDVMSDRISAVQSVLQGGDAEMAQIVTDLTTENTKREALKGRIKSLVAQYKAARRLLDRGVQEWSEAVRGGLPPDSVDQYLDTGLKSASDAALEKAESAALSRHLSPHFEKINSEIVERLETQAAMSGISSLLQVSSEVQTASSFLQARSRDSPIVGSPKIQKTAPAVDLDTWAGLCKNVNRVVAVFKQYEIDKIQNTKSWDAWHGVCEQMVVTEGSRSLAQTAKRKHGDQLRKLIRQTLDTPPSPPETADLVMALEMKQDSHPSTGLNSIHEREKQEASKAGLVEMLATLNAMRQIVKDEVATQHKQPERASAVNQSVEFLSKGGTSKVDLVSGNRDGDKNVTRLAFKASLAQQVKDLMRSVTIDADPTRQVQSLIKKKGPLQDIVHQIAALQKRVVELEKTHPPQNVAELQKTVEDAKNLIHAQQKLATVILAN